MGERDRPTFGELVRRFRRSIELSQEALAERAGVSLRTVNELERNGPHQPYPDTVKRLATALNLTDEELGELESAALRAPRDGRHAARGRQLAAPFQAAAPLVGRSSEMEELRSALASAAHGACSAFVTGEPGIGKSRLCYEVANEALERGHTVLFGQCHPDEHAWPYGPVVRALSRYCRRQPVSNLRSELRGCGEIGRLLPELVLDLPKLPSTDTLPLDQQRRLLHRAIATFMANLASPAPAVLLLDDLQWSGETNLALLRDLMDEGENLPLLALCACRDGEVVNPYPLAALVAALEEQKRVKRLLLEPLNMAEARAFAEMQPKAPRYISDENLSRAGGNPFLTQGLIAGMVSNSVSANGVPSEAKLVADSISLRAAALPEPGIEVLRIAAAMRGILPPGLVQHVLGISDAAALTVLDAARGARLLRETAEGYVFQHDLIRDTLYEDLGRERRAILHGRIGEVLAQDRKARSGHAAKLAYHFSRSPRHREQAIAALDLAGREAAQLYANDEAAQHFNRALAMLAGLHSSPRIRGQIRALQIAIAEVEHRRGMLDSARAALEAALSLAEEPEERAMLLRRIGVLAAGRGDDASPYFAAAEALLGKHPICVEWVRLQIAKASLRVERGDFAAALPMLLEAQTLLQSLGAASHALGDLAATYNALGNALYTNGEAPEVTRRAIGYWRQALALWKACGDADGQVRALNNLGLGYRRVAKWNRAIEYLRRAEELCARQGHRLYQAVTWNNQAECLLGIGHWLEARSISEKGAHAAARVDHIPAMAHAYVNTALICLALGDLSAAEHWLARSRNLFELFDSPTHKWITLRGLGQVAEARGNLALAASYYRDSRIAGEAGGIRCVAHSLIAMARVARLGGRIALAGTARNEADVLLREAPTGDWADLLRAALALEEGKYQMADDNWEAAAGQFAYAASLSLHVASEPAEASIVRIQATIADGLRALGQASKGSGDVPLLIEEAEHLLDNGMTMARESGHFATLLLAQFARAELSMMIGDRENAHLLVEQAHISARATGYEARAVAGD